MALEGPAGAQRPEHAKQQAIDMLGGDAAEDGRALQLGAPQLLQGAHFIGQLAQALVDQLGFAAGTGGAEGQAAAVEIQAGRR